MATSQKEAPERIFRERHGLHEELEVLNLILENIYNGILVTDAHGYITHFNIPYGQFLGVDPEGQIGKHVTEVIENTRMRGMARSSHWSASPRIHLAITLLWS